MSYSVRRLELEGCRVIASASARHTHPDLWRAQNEAEKLVRAHTHCSFNQELACWEGIDLGGRTFRYFALPL